MLRNHIVTTVEFEKVFTLALPAHNITPDTSKARAVTAAETWLVPPAGNLPVEIFKA